MRKNEVVYGGFDFDLYLAPVAIIQSNEKIESRLEININYDENTYIVNLNCDGNQYFEKYHINNSYSGRISVLENQLILVDFGFISKVKNFFLLKTVDSIDTFACGDGDGVEVKGRDLPISIKTIRGSAWDQTLQQHWRHIH